jgi:type VI protein secretion system component Hcp
MSDHLTFMSKKAVVMFVAGIAAVSAVFAVSAFAANGRFPSDGKVPNGVFSGHGNVQYTLSLTEGGVTKALQLHSLQWGLSHKASVGVGGSRETSAPSFSDLSFTADSGALSPDLMLAAAQGTSFTSGILTITENGSPAITIELKQPIIASYQMTASDLSRPGIPMDSVTLNFTSISVKTSAGTSASWDLVQNSSGSTVSGGWNLKSISSS